MTQGSERELSEARNLVDQGEHRRALKALQRARRSALAEQDVAELEEILQLALRIWDETRGRVQYDSGSLVHSATQNIRFVTRQLALERGERWVDPTVPRPPAPSPAQPPARATGPSVEDVVTRLDRLEDELRRLGVELAAVRLLVHAQPEPGPEVTTPARATPPEPVVTTAAPAPPRAPEPAAPPAQPVSHAPPTFERRHAAAHPPAPPPRPPRRSLGQLARDWDLVGARGFAIVGGAVMALGIGLFFVLASNRGWIDDRARVALGAAASALVLGAGLVLRARFGQYWAALAAVGAGLAGAYATLAAAAARYDLVPDALALPLAGVIAAVGTVIALRWNSQVIAGIGLMGAALAPALQAIDTGMTWTSAAFALIVLVAAAVVAVPRHWSLLLAAIAIVVGLQVLVLAVDAGVSPGAGTVAVAAGLVAALLLIGVGLQLVTREVELDPTALSYALAAFGASIALTLLLFEGRDDRGITLFVAAGFWALVAGALAWRKQPDLGLAVGVAALGLAGAGTAYLLTDSALVVAWAAESVVLSVLARRFGDARLQVLAIVYVVLAAGRAFDTEGDPRLLLDDAADHLAGVLPLASVAVAALAALVLWPHAYRPRTEAGPLSFVGDLRRALEAHATGLREALAFATVAVGTLAVAFALVAASFDAGHVAASVVAAAVGAVLLAYAGRADSEAAIAASFVWLGAVLVEALAFDSSILGESEIGPSGGWSVIAAAAGLVAGAYALHVIQPAREEWDVVCGVAAGGGLIACWIGLVDLTDSDTSRGGGLLVAAAVYVALAAFVFRREGLRTFATTLWSLGLISFVGAERLLFESDVLFVIAAAATGAAVGALAEPLREQRLWFAGAITTGLATAVELVAVAPPSHLFSPSEDPARGLAGLVFCVLALAALAKLAEGRRERVVSGIAAGGVAVYAVSLGILDIAERLSTASVETDFERGHTAVSGLWALIGLALLVLGLLRGSAALRYGGLALFGLSLAKIFLYDLAELSSVARAFSFILVGGLLLAGGFFLQRLSDRIGPPKPPATPTIDG